MSEIIKTSVKPLLIRGDEAAAKCVNEKMDVRTFKKWVKQRGIYPAIGGCKGSQRWWSPIILERASLDQNPRWSD